MRPISTLQGPGELFLRQGSRWIFVAPFCVPGALHKAKLCTASLVQRLVMGVWGSVPLLYPLTAGLPLKRKEGLSRHRGILWRGRAWPQVREGGGMCAGRTEGEADPGVREL